jgi:hypothetical protein
MEQVCDDLLLLILFELREWNVLAIPVLSSSMNNRIKSIIPRLAVLFDVVCQLTLPKLYMNIHQKLNSSPVIGTDHFYRLLISRVEYVIYSREDYGTAYYTLPMRVKFHTPKYVQSINDIYNCLHIPDENSIMLLSSLHLRVNSYCRADYNPHLNMIEITSSCTRELINF